MKKYLNNLLYPLAAALIWGVSFPAQAVCIQYMSAFWINATRSLIAAALLFAICFFRKKKTGKNPGKTKDIVTGSIICGIFLFTAVNLQQLGIADTSAGKAGFITALYTVLVPIFGLFVGRRVGIKIWISIAIAVAGLYFLCIKDGFRIEPGDMLLMLCAVFFALQMIFLSIFTQKVDPIALSCGQFFVTGILSLATALIFEDFSAQNFAGCIVPLLYIAVFSSCVAYTLQVVSFRTGNPAVLSLLFSLESVFAVLSGAVILGERLSGRELVGCVVMFGAVILAELPEKRREAKTV